MGTPEEKRPRSETSRDSNKLVRPRDAATLVIYDFDSGAVRILMGRRRMDQVFLPGHYVFPGGRVDRQDAKREVATPLHPLQTDNLKIGMGSRASDSRAQALGLAAVRETFEETGYLVGTAVQADTASGQYPHVPGQSFDDAGLAPALDGLVYFCRAITPPGRPRRYDTRFFAVPRSAVSGPHAIGDGELEDIGWRTLEEVRLLKLPSITRLVLEDISQLLASILKPPVQDAGTETLTVGIPAGIPFYFQRNGVFQRVVLSRTLGAP
jgi:8-oxo-dGTP pyrophosphatase MutT (NUDIX family)